jgi:hypothetical protein
MPQANHQTIKLSKGKHSSPEQGACVMELASMLAGERFSDHPRSVSRPVASFLRGYNDLIDDDRRGDLIAYAARTVGTADSPELEQARVDRLLAWGDELWERRSSASMLDRIRRSRASKGRRRDPEAAGTYAVRAMTDVSYEMHAAALALVEELLTLGSRRHVRPAPDMPEPVYTGAPGASGCRA